MNCRQFGFLIVTLVPFANIFSSANADEIVFREVSSFGRSVPLANDRFGESVAVLGDGRVAVSNSPALLTQPSFCVFNEEQADWTEEECITVGSLDEGSFWFNIAADGGVVVAGVPDHDEPPCCNGVGAVYFYEEDDAGEWQETQVLVDDWWATGGVGWHVDIRSNTAVAGAISDNTVASGAGAAYVFERQSFGVWDQVAKLLPDAVDGTFQKAGYNVAISDDGQTIVVGALGTTTTNGKAYIYRRNPSGSWVHSDTLNSDSPLKNDSFGITVAISNDTILVASPGGFNEPDCELVYVFTNTTGVWEQTAELRPWGITPEELFWFGAYDIGLRDNRAYVGSAGHVYVFVRVGNEWENTAKLFAGEQGAYFGKGFDFLEDDRVAFGAPFEDGTKNDEGRVHVFSGELVTVTLPNIPVVFVHGLASNGFTWNRLASQLFAEGIRFGGYPEYQPDTGDVVGTLAGDLYQIHFSDWADNPPAQNLTFAEQGQELAAVIRKVREVNDNISEVLLVGHSMGGLAARSYLQGLAVDAPYREDVLRLITVGSPHQGSFLAAICNLFPITCIASDIDSGSVAVEELEPGSDALIELNDLFGNRFPDGVEYTTVVGLGQNTVAESGFEPGDGLVTEDSQDPPFFIPSWETVELQIEDCGEYALHTCETRDSGVQQKILQRIKPEIFSDGFESGSFSNWLLAE